MENNVFWAFLVVTFIVGLTLGVAIYGVPAGITGRAAISPFLPSISCNDTDGGINLAVKGFCFDPYGNRTDVCSSSVDLIEYWCMNGTNVSYCVSKVYNCLDYGYAGCYNGACLRNQTNQTQITSQEQEQEQTQAMLGYTYQKVLDMLNKCTITYSRNDSNVSCNNVCQNQGKTCVQAYSFDELSEVTFPYECDWMAGINTNALICNCCSPLSERAEPMGPGGNTVCHYPPDWPDDCVSGFGRWRCDGMCGGGTVK